MLDFIRPGRPIENAIIENFNDRLRVNTNWFVSLRDAQIVIEDWRREYNKARPHSALGN